MSSFRVRPRFKQLCDLSQKEVESRLKAALDEENADCVAVSLPGHVYLKIPLEERHFWSPQLHITFEEDGKGTVIRGLYGPNPTVWAIFFFGYVSLGLIFFFAGMWGLSRWSLDMSAGVLWVLPITAVLALVLYIIAQTGQKIGAEQMYRLHLFYEGTIGKRTHIS
jgi:hypothetical protein